MDVRRMDGTSRQNPVAHGDEPAAPKPLDSKRPEGQGYTEALYERPRSSAWADKAFGSPVAFTAAKTSKSQEATAASAVAPNPFPHLSPEFPRLVAQMAQRLGIPAEHLVAVMFFETATTMSPSIRNPSGATGLIQIMPVNAARMLGIALPNVPPEPAKDAPEAEKERYRTAAELNKNLLNVAATTLAGMTAEAQLEFVEKHFRGVIGNRKISSLADTYMAVLCPAAVGKGESQAAYKAPTGAYTSNKKLDLDGDGIITAGEATERVRQASLNPQAQWMMSKAKEEAAKLPPLAPSSPARPRSPATAPPSPPATTPTPHAAKPPSAPAARAPTSAPAARAPTATEAAIGRIKLDGWMASAIVAELKLQTLVKGFPDISSKLSLSQLSAIRGAHTTDFADATSVVVGAAIDMAIVRAKRERVAHVALGYAGLSAEKNRDKYLEVLAGNVESKKTSESMLKMSSCALFARGVWRLSGVESSVLSRPYVTEKAVIDVKTNIASANQAWVKADGGKVLPHTGDVLLIGPVEHVIVVVSEPRARSDGGWDIDTVEGGQPPNGTSIQSFTRQLRVANGKLMQGDRTVDGWADAAKLPMKRDLE
jgi:hypothetical protein